MAPASSLLPSTMEATRTAVVEALPAWHMLALPEGEPIVGIIPLADGLHMQSEPLCASASDAGNKGPLLTSAFYSPDSIMCASNFTKKDVAVHGGTFFMPRDPTRTSAPRLTRPAPRRPACHDRHDEDVETVSPFTMRKKHKMQLQPVTEEESEQLHPMTEEDHEASVLTSAFSSASLGPRSIGQEPQEKSTELWRAELRATLRAPRTRKPKEPTIVALDVSADMRI